MTPADVSAVVCTRNSISGIERCLTSLRRAGVCRIIVVDADSTDGTREIAERLADTVVADLGTGLGNARKTHNSLDCRTLWDSGRTKCCCGRWLEKAVWLPNKGVARW